MFLCCSQDEDDMKTVCNMMEKFVDAVLEEFEAKNLPTDKFNENAFRAIKEKVMLGNSWNREDYTVGELYFDEKKKWRGAETFEFSGKKGMWSLENFVVKEKGKGKVDRKHARLSALVEEIQERVFKELFGDDAV